MNHKPRVVFQVGAPAFHPVREQAQALAQRFSESYSIVPIEGAAVFDHLDACELLILGGLDWTGAVDLGEASLPYETPDEGRREAYRSYVSSGRPLLGFHGGIASYDDWPEFARLLGFRWHWGITNHTPVDSYRVEIGPTGEDELAERLRLTVGTGYTITDELYFNVCVGDDIGARVYALAQYHDVTFPMIIAGEGGRIPGAGRTAYFANGHDLRALETPAFSSAFNAICDWLLRGENT